MTEACRFELVEGNHFATCQTHAPICMDDFSELLRAQVCTIGLAELRIQLAMRTGWQRCDTHGEINADHAWGCPECVREMRNHLDAIAPKNRAYT